MKEINIEEDNRPEKGEGTDLINCSKIQIQMMMTKMKSYKEDSNKDRNR